MVKLLMTIEVYFLLYLLSLIPEQEVHLTAIFRQRC